MPAVLSEDEFLAFQGLVYTSSGIHLAPNKRDMLANRLARRLTALGLPDYGAYYRLLMGGDPTGEEREQFINCITTNKTHFFREPHHFEFLRDRLIPELRARVAAGAPRRLRIWSAACSSGEEPYSIAMVAHRALAHDGYAIEIAASDIDTEILGRAHDGRYASSQLAEVPADLRTRYLVQRDGHWQVTDELRAIVQLHHINLIHDRFPFQGPFDAIFIRNVIIYFDRPSQTTLFQRLRGYLGDTSYLFLGHSESLLHLTDTFVPAGPTIYQPRPRAPQPGAGGAHRRAPTTRRGRATITRLDPGKLAVSREPARIDCVVGPCVSVCMFDPRTKLGGMVQVDGDSGPGTARAIQQLIARLTELGASQPELRAKLVGGGGTTTDQRGRGDRAAAIVEAELRRAGIPLASKRVGGDGRLEIQFFTASGRLLCREHLTAPEEST